MTKRQTIIFVLVVAVLYGLGLFWGLPSVLTAASDSTAPLGPLSFVAEYRDPNKSYVYPAVHQLLLACVYGVIIVGCKLSGYLGALSSAWPYGFRDPTTVFSAFILASNVVSLLMGLVVLVSLKRVRPTESYAAWFPMLLLAASGVFAYYARVANMDMPYLCWWWLSYVCLWHYVFSGRPRRRLLLCAAAAAALAIGTKDQSAGLILGSGLILLFIPARGTADGWTVRIKSAALFSCALFAAYALVAVAPNPWRWLHHVRFVTSDHVLPEYEQSLRGQVLLFGRFLVRLSHVMTPLGIALGVAGLCVLARLRKHREALVLLLPAVAYYVSIIAKVRSTEERYLLPIAILLAVSAGVAVGAGLAATHVRARQLRLLTLGVVAFVLAQQFVWSFIPVTYTQLFDARRALARDIGQIVPPGAPLLIADMPSFNVPNRYIYERYALMHPPGEKLFPLSTHGENLFHPYDPAHRFILAGSPTTQTAWPNAHSQWPDTNVELIGQWTYPAWIKTHVYVPSVYEFYLFRRQQVTISNAEQGQSNPAQN